MSSVFNTFLRSVAWLDLDVKCGQFFCKKCDLSVFICFSLLLFVGLDVAPFLEFAKFLDALIMM